ncbi:hypothetical protein [Nonomuraea deserti]|uniref:hypothetical protein n=1 Tax=Nonomuraea deserti TaxID=1848322 RepID=UPI001404AB2D|nr:hypothetical protein [Nonomuraea deserti]
MASHYGTVVVRAESNAEKDELARLRRENRILREEKGILRKAAVFFARGPDLPR